MLCCDVVRVSVVLSYAVSAFFSNAVLATLVSIIVYAVLFLPFFLVLGINDDLPYWAEFLVVSLSQHFNMIRP